MDWDRMKARDLLALFNSFTPQGGAVLSVKVLKQEVTEGILFLCHSLKTTKISIIIFLYFTSV